MSASTAAASCRRRRCSMRSASIRKRSSTISTPRSPSSVRRTAPGPRRWNRAGCATPRPIRTGRTPRPAKCWPKPAPRSRVRGLRKWQEDGIKQISLSAEDELIGRYSALDMVNPETGEIYVEAGDELTAANLATARRSRLRRNRRHQCRRHHHRRLCPQHAGGGQEPLAASRR